MKNRRFSNRKPNHFCPVSPHLAWHWGLMFKDCPICVGERGMEECMNCPLRGLASDVQKEKLKKGRKNED